MVQAEAPACRLKRSVFCAREVIDQRPQREREGTPDEVTQKFLEGERG